LNIFFVMGCNPYLPFDQVCLEKLQMFSAVCYVIKVEATMTA